MTGNSHYINVDTALGEKRIHYTDWGNKLAEQTLVCTHGYIRNCHDFDVLATTLCDKYRIICLDAPGRGSSDWLNETLYHQESYAHIALQVLDQLGIDTFHWLGTSMGGITGCITAGISPSRMTSLILNDVGAIIDASGVKHVKTYVANKPHFENLEQAEAYFRDTYKAFGDLSNNDWQRMAKYSVKKSDDGYVLHYDPALGDMALHFPETDMDYWDLWNKVKCPALILHGRDSSYLNAGTVSDMCNSRENVYAVHVANTGHAPGLTTPKQIEIIQNWLASLKMPSEESSI